MAFTGVRVYTNCDMTMIVWQTGAPIADCRGFALEREVTGGAPGPATNDLCAPTLASKARLTSLPKASPARSGRFSGTSGPIT